MNQPTRRSWQRNALRITLAVVSCLLIAVLMCLNLPTTSAQGTGNILGKDTTVTGTLNDQTRVMLYSYAGTAGEVISAQVVGISQGMNPTINLLSPDQAVLASNNDDPFQMGHSRDARLSYRLPATGNYSLLITGTNGDFVLRFIAQGPFTQIPLSNGVIANANLSPGIPPQSYGFTIAPGESVTLNISNASAGFLFAAQVYNPSGQMIAALGGPGIQTEELTICGNSGPYEVIIGASDATSQVIFQLVVLHNAADDCSTTQDTSGIPPTLVAVGGTPVPSNVCSATNIKPNFINLRRGPSVFWNIVGQVEINGSIPVSGRSMDGQWYLSTDGTKQSWVAANVVALNGPCLNLPAIQAPPPPFTRTPTPTATFTPLPPTERPRHTRTPNLSQTPFLITQTPIIITQTPVVITASPTNTLTPTFTNTP